VRVDPRDIEEAAKELYILVLEGLRSMMFFLVFDVGAYPFYLGPGI
jgi:hypothetical protein